MIKWLKKYWWAVLIVCATPIALNFILLSRARTSIIGDETTWLMFWSSYASALITGGITLFVLYRQLMQNQNENENNRKLQLSLLLYQQERQRYNDLKIACIENIKLFDTTELVIPLWHLANNKSIIAPTETGEYLQKIKSVYNKLTETSTLLMLLLNKNDEPHYYEYIKKYRSALDAYLTMLDDIADTSVCLMVKSIEDVVAQTSSLTVSDNMKQLIDKYTRDSNRVHKRVNYITDVLTPRITQVKDIKMNMLIWTLNYLEAEEICIDKTLNNHYVTKQTK